MYPECVGCGEGVLPSPLNHCGECNDWLCLACKEERDGLCYACDEQARAEWRDTLDLADVRATES